MSDLATLARPYAEAVFKRAKEAKASDKWSEMLAFVALVMQDKDLVALVKNPKVTEDQIVGLILEISPGMLDKEGENFVKLLAQYDRLLLAPEIAILYENYKAEDEGYVDVDVSSAFALTKEEEKKLTASLTKTLNKTVRLNTDVDKTLIGGFLARAGDIVIDGSIKGQLQQLTKRL
jgi:F-type H+-transporting ATPase subunit delta